MEIVKLLKFQRVKNLVKIWKNNGKGGEDIFFIFFALNKYKTCKMLETLYLCLFYA